MPPMSVSALYNYQPWARGRRLQSQTDTQISTTGQNGSVVINMGQDGGPSPNGVFKEKKPETLFGPSIGAVSSGPSWTNTGEKKVLSDELTPEILRGWTDKSKEPSFPTTTLQALVNLKRPTLRLSPLTSVQEDSLEEPHHQLHGLEFEYDCDAAKCGIYVHVLLPREHPDAPPTAYANGLSKLTVFETVVEGGFNKILKLEEGATLELGRFENIPKVHPSDENEGGAASGSLSSAPGNNAGSGPTNGSSTDITAAISPESENATGNNNIAASAGASRPSRRRFSHFHFRKRPLGRSISGPALAVVDEPSTVVVGTDDGTKTKEFGKEEEVNGIRVIIRLAALDEQGTELLSPNEQVTYLHVVRFGAKMPATIPEDAELEEQEDTRPWVVKVVKREATIGPHTFHLHEIYGLTSGSQQAAVPTAPVPGTPQSHTYPPESSPQQPIIEDEPSSECLLCLSSPREVVLLPCRHLVACKDCALNMVEFGAGGNINHVDEPQAPPAAVTSPGQAAPSDQAAAGDSNPGDPATAGGQAAMPAPAAGTTAPPPAVPRRKRRPKGWFCPVCRQPYTSLLRISTGAPPEVPEEDKEAGVITNGLNGLGISELPGTPNPNVTPNPAGTSGGLLSGSFGPSFLRNLSFRGTGAASGQTQADVENQIGAANATASARA